MKNISQYVMYALIAIGAITFILSFSGSYEPLLNIMYLYSGIALVATVGAAVYTAILKPDNIKPSLIGFGALAIVVVISYMLADDSVPEKYSTTLSVSASKWSGTGLYAFYLLFAGAIASIIVTGILNLVKK